MNSLITQKISSGKLIAKRFAVLFLCLLMAAACAFPAMAAGPGEPDYYDYFKPEDFGLPADAQMLVVVGGMEGTRCKVYVFEKNAEAEGDQWKFLYSANGQMGRNGMSNNRKEGDGTTPIGIWQLNTPFGQKPAEEGFPANYVQVNGNDYVWTEKENKLMVDTTGILKGERVGSQKYAGYYNYAIDAGYNKNAVPGKGSALFLHCLKPEEGGSSGCIKIPEQNMKQVLRLYAKYGDGKCYIAQAPLASMKNLYGTYGKFNGLCPDGKF